MVGGGLVCEDVPCMLLEAKRFEDEPTGNGRSMSWASVHADDPLRRWFRAAGRGHRRSRAPQGAIPIQLTPERGVVHATKQTAPTPPSVAARSTEHVCGRLSNHGRVCS